MDKAHAREEHSKYDVVVANKVLQHQQEDKRWENTDMHEDNEEDGESR